MVLKNGPVEDKINYSISSISKQLQ